MSKVTCIGTMPYYTGYAGRTATVGALPYYTGYAGRTGTVGSIPSFTLSQRAYNPAGDPRMTNRVQPGALNPFKVRIHGYGAIPAGNLPYSTSRSVELARLRSVSGIISDTYASMTNGSWKPLWDTLTGAEQEQAKDLSQKIYDLNNKLYSSGKWTKDQLDAANNNLASDRPDDYVKQIIAATDSVISDEVDAVYLAIKNTAATLVKIATDAAAAAASGVVSATPWWVYAGIALYVANYLGVFKLAEGSVYRKYRGTSI